MLQDIECEADVITWRDPQVSVSIYFVVLCSKLVIPVTEHLVEVVD